MFSNCTSLTTIYVSESFTTAAITGTTNGMYMFSSCAALVGGNGTVFSSSHTNKEYARIDTAETPGYFTYKQAG